MHCAVTDGETQNSKKGITKTSYDRHIFSSNVHVLFTKCWTLNFGKNNNAYRKYLCISSKVKSLDGVGLLVVSRLAKLTLWLHNLLSLENMRSANGAQK